MAVVTSERSEGELAVIVKAKGVAEHTLRVTNNTNYFPKRYRLTLTDKMVDKAIDIYTYLYEANEIAPKNRREADERFYLQRKAMASCRVLNALIDLSKTAFNLPADKVKYWSKLVTEVRYMTAAWYRKDRDRYNFKQ